MTDQLPDIEDENPKNIEIRIDIERALEQLPEEIKEIVILFFFQGLKQKNCLQNSWRWKNYEAISEKNRGV